MVGSRVVVWECIFISIFFFHVSIALGAVLKTLDEN